MLWLRCVGQEQASCIVEEIHQGTCGTDEGATILGNKIFKQEYY